MSLSRAAALVAIACLPGTAFAGSLADSEPTPLVTAPTEAAPAAPRNSAQFTIGAGVSAQPGYFGSDETIIGPTGTFRLEGLTLFGATLMDPNADPYGLGVHGSVRTIAARTASDFPELTGLADIDQSVEIGAGLSYAQPGYEIFADLRYGAIGHESLVAEIGADMFVRPSGQLTLSAGPRLFFGDDSYAATYFGVTAAEATTSAYSAYDARGGILSGGIEIGAEYAVTDDWGLEGTIRYDRYLGDAADSPIVLGGSDDSISASIMATRRFSLEF